IRCCSSSLRTCNGSRRMTRVFRNFMSGVLMFASRAGSCMLAMALVACAAPMPDIPEPDDPRFAPVMTLTPAHTPHANGSIYQAGRAVDLYQRRAYRMGDVLTINLNEATTARKSSGTSYS